MFILRHLLRLSLLRLLLLLLLLLLFLLREPERDLDRDRFRALSLLSFSLSLSLSLSLSRSFALRSRMMARRFSLSFSSLSLSSRRRRILSSRLFSLSSSRAFSSASISATWRCHENTYTQTWIHSTNPISTAVLFVWATDCKTVLHKAAISKEDKEQRREYYCGDCIHLHNLKCWFKIHVYYYIASSSPEHQ